MAMFFTILTFLSRYKRKSWQIRATLNSYHMDYYLKKRHEAPQKFDLYNRIQGPNPVGWGRLNRDL